MNNSEVANSGFVYILNSPNSKYIKIGGTDFPPLKRISEINATEPYKSHGPWGLFDFREVTNWRKIEYHLHYTFRSKLVGSIENQKELFEISPHDVSQTLNEIDECEIVRKPKVDRMFQDEEMLNFAVKLFKYTGLINWINLQGAWTFTLFPMTSGGRYYTINIGPHEVAFCVLPKKSQKPCHMILMDKLIFDFENVKEWIKSHNGTIKEDAYETALPRSASLIFDGSFKEAEEFMQLTGVRRALIAYWTEALIELKEQRKLSPYARYHNWNAIARINAMVRSEMP